MRLFLHKGFKLVFITILLIVVFLPQSICGASDPAQVLIINSYHLGYSWSDAEMEGVKNGFKSDVEIATEFMDTKRIETEDYLQALTELIQMKYADNQFDLIITLDDRAYQYILEYHDILFPDIPVIFAGVNDFSEEDVQDIPWITGTVETIDYAELISLIHQVRPDAQAVHLITDSTYTGYAYRQQMSALQEQGVFSIPVNIIGDYEAGIEWSQLLQEISHLPEENAILYLGYTRDIRGNIFNEKETTSTIAKTANVPVFVDETQFLHGGTIGGKLKDPYLEGFSAGIMGQKILDGDEPSQIPIRSESNTIYRFDYEALEQWEIPIRILPEDSTFINEPQRNMVIDREVAIIMLIVVLFQSSLIVLLFSLNRRRKVAETALRNEQLLLEQKVKERTHELQEAIHVKDRFLANMSHELRTPLTAILGFSELMLLQTHNDPQNKLQKSIKHIQQSGEHLLSLINDILTVAKINANQIKLMPTQIMIEHLMHDTVMMIEGKSKQKDITIQWEADPYLSTVCLDERRIRQVFIILLDNAIKFSPEGSTIQFSANLQISDSSKVVFSVQDQGMGIAEEDHIRIFEPFVQADNELTRAFEGSGLGLTLAKQLVELHGGSIEVQSALEAGTTMNVTLPIDVINQESMKFITQKAKTRIKDPTARLTSLTILLVEDNPVTTDLLTSFFDEQKITVKIATDGKKAIESVREENPDVILLDLHLPVMDGFEVIRKIRSKGKHKETPIIVVSALVFEEEITKCLELGANAFLKKPFSLNDLMDEIYSLFT